MVQEVVLLEVFVYQPEERGADICLDVVRPGRVEPENRRPSSSSFLLGFLVMEIFLETRIPY